MTTGQLHEALTELISAFDAADDDGVYVASASVTVPMEVQIQSRGRSLVAFAAPSASRWVTGVMAPVHQVRLTATSAKNAVSDQPGTGQTGTTQSHSGDPR